MKKPAKDREQKRAKALERAEEKAKQNNKGGEWTAPDVMTFAGEVMRRVMELAEAGRPVEKRVCRIILDQATRHVNDQRYQRALKKMLGDL